MPRVKGPARAKEEIHPDSLLGMSEPRSVEKMAGINGEADNIDIVLHSFQNPSLRFPRGKIQGLMSQNIYPDS